MGKAIAYRLTHWEGLTRFLDHGELEIDNNATEREIKVLVMARKNFLFSYSVEGAEALGIYFSVIQSAREHGLEPESYLTAVFKAIPLCKTYEDYAALLPWNYAKTLSESDHPIPSREFAPGIASATSHPPQDWPPTAFGDGGRSTSRSTNFISNFIYLVLLKHDN